jgi:hypothetical protein
MSKRPAYKLTHICEVKHNGQYTGRVTMPDTQIYRVQTDPAGCGLYVRYLDWAEVLSPADYGAKSVERFRWMVREAVAQHPEAFN